VRRVSALLSVAFALVSASASSLALSATPAAAESGTTAYTAQAPVVDTVSGGPWNTSQGNPSAGAEYESSDLLPTFAFGGSETTLGGVNEPNVAVYPNEKEPVGAPYPSGVVGTPGPLNGYCSNTEHPDEGSPVPQPAGSLPMAPYYFPDVVRNSDGSLTGYFDYRPKDTEEAITVAKSTNGGQSWTTEGEALGENSGYCPVADTNDDGQGHPYVTQIGGSSKLYTLNRPAGDYEGVGLLVHNVQPTAPDPLTGLEGDEPVGIDPNTFATGEVVVPDSSEGGSATIPVSTLGEANSPEDIVAGPYEDYDAPSPSGSIITCASVSSEPTPELTGCTVSGSSSLKVKENADLVQVIATANPGAGKTYEVPKGPNLPDAEGGLAEIKILNGNTAVSPLTTFILNENAPNRLYIDGVTVYCAQSNANPTTKIEDCTADGGSSLTVHQGDAITADPIIPPHAQVTTGLKAPDGIVGTLPAGNAYANSQTCGSECAPAGSTVVLYTQKVLAYFVVGTTDGPINSKNEFKAGAVTLPASTINFKPSVHPSEKLPSGGPFTIYLGSINSKKEAEPIQAVTCNGTAAPTEAQKAPAGSINLTSCSGGSGEVAEGNWIGGPNAAATQYPVLAKIGEGKNSKKGPEKLFSNNEDLTELRAAYTYNGVEFHDLGAISGEAPGTVNDKGEYTGISNPYQQASPRSSSQPNTATTEPESPTDLSPGSVDDVELRFVGSRGTIVTNPNGTYGMFLSGSWASDGDSDAFNQIFYSESSNGKEWSAPKVVLSTEYEFNASREQDEALAQGEDKPLGISAYYSGRAYGPSVVQNPNGTLTMVFAGYRLPKPIEPAGTKVGTGSAQYTVGTKDPALYRNILTMQLSSSTSPGVASETTVSASDEGTGVVGAPVTYTATVAPRTPGTGTPTGGVAFSDSHGPIAGCAEAKLDEGSPDTATCATTHGPAGSDEVTATYAGDSNYAGSSGETTENVQEAPAITSADEATFTEGSAGSLEVTATGTPKPALSESGTLPEGVGFDAATGKLSGTPTQEGVFHIEFTAANGVGSNAVQSFTLTVDAPPVITSASGATFTYGVSGSFTVKASGTPSPFIEEWGNLPEGVSYSDGVLSGTPTQIGGFKLTFTAENGIGADSVQRFTLTVLGLHITTTSLPEASPGVAYSQQLQAIGGIPPYKWKVTAGSLPRGLRLSRTGLLSGKVNAKANPHGGSFPVTVTVTDRTKRVHQTASAAFTLLVS
jgi:hypothetical protein